MAPFWQLREMTATPMDFLIAEASSDLPTAERVGSLYPLLLYSTSSSIRPIAIGPSPADRAKPLFPATADKHGLTVVSRVCRRPSALSQMAALYRRTGA